eukprot:GHVU01119349.1.p1 GENE.GHVU01119349.1~~GHVU01119349.1.p1  ORF type:complete len:603 (+),score=118.25 GHVU01119349.1:974-2782(+)
MVCPPGYSEAPRSSTSVEPIHRLAGSRQGAPRRLGKRVMKRAPSPLPYSATSVVRIHPPAAAAVECVRSESVRGELTCPLGFERRGEELCLKEVWRDPELTCVSEGYVVDRRTQTCYREFAEPAKLSCEDESWRLSPLGVGGELVDDLGLGTVCTLERTKPAFARCRDGFTFNAQDGMCSRVLTEPPEMVCDEAEEEREEREGILGALLNFEAGGGSTRGGSTASSQLQLQQRRQRQTASDSGDTLPFRFDGRVCRAVASAPPRRSCEGVASEFVAEMRGNAAEARLLGNECVWRTESPAEPRCDAHGGEFVFDPTLGRCLNAATERVAVSCPSGFEPAGDGDDTCVGSSAAPPVPSCEPGYLFSEREGGRCLQETISEPELVCHSSPPASPPSTSSSSSSLGVAAARSGSSNMMMMMSRDDAADGNGAANVASPPPPPQLLGTHCVQHRREPPLLHCAAGFDLQGGGPTSAAAAQQHLLPPTGSSSSSGGGGRVGGPVCVREEAGEMSSVCDSGYSMFNKSCVKQQSVAGRGVCPEGYQRAGLMECELQERQPAVLACDPPLRLDPSSGDRCVADGGEMMVGLVVPKKNVKKGRGAHKGGL